MSWLELDDGILDHPKFIRAVKLGGSEAVHLWLGLRAYCGKHLTDGAVPRDMLDEVRGPANLKRRAEALAALFTVGLLEDHGNTVHMHDYLQWSSSRDAVLLARERARERKARSRGGHTVTDAVTTRAVTPVVTNPSSSPLPPPLPSPPPKEISDARERAEPAPPPAPSKPVRVAPANWEQAMQVPLAERARSALENPDAWAWCEPQRWPEVGGVASALARAAGQARPRLGDVRRDAGVRAVLGLFADGHAGDGVAGLQRLVELVERVGRSKWYRERGKGLSSLTAEVLRRAENDHPGSGAGPPLDRETQKQIDRMREMQAEIGNGGTP